MKVCFDSLMEGQWNFAVDKKAYVAAHSGLLEERNCCWNLSPVVMSDGPERPRCPNDTLTGDGVYSPVPITSYSKATPSGRFPAIIFRQRLRRQTP
jgi:hypothetical protein